MLCCFRRTCPFGLPDDAEAIEDIVLVSVGHALALATAHTIAEPLPASLTALLAQLGRRERAQSQPSQAPPRQRTARPQSAVASAGTPAIAEAQAA
jgi:hypothetical protein